MVATDAASGEVLVMGQMNAEALLQTIETGEARYWSRSRQCLWHKGATSGLVQKVIQIRTDDDQDAIWPRVQVEGSARCHVGYRSCFIGPFPLVLLAKPQSFLPAKRQRRRSIRSRFMGAHRIRRGSGGNSSETSSVSSGRRLNCGP
ncbi:phosphoribosyl-AMP cyclohydrolase [Bradyrhizobium sp. Arg314]